MEFPTRPWEKIVVMILSLFHLVKSFEIIYYTSKIDTCSQVMTS